MNSRFRRGACWILVASDRDAGDGTLARIYGPIFSLAAANDYACGLLWCFCSVSGVVVDDEPARSKMHIAKTNISLHVLGHCCSVPWEPG